MRTLLYSVSVYPGFRDISREGLDLKSITEALEWVQTPSFAPLSHVTCSYASVVGLQESQFLWREVKGSSS